MSKLLVGLLLATVSISSGAQDGQISRVTLDVYVRPDSQRCGDLVDYLTELQKSREGLVVVVHDVVDDLDARRDLYSLGRRYHVEKIGLPAIHVMDRFHLGYSDTETNRRRVRDLLKVEVFTRDGCPRCRDAKVFLSDLAHRWPALEFDIREIVSDRAARDRMMQLARHYKVTATSVPAFHLCGKLKIGYLGPSITGRQIESMIRTAARSRSVDTPRPTETPSARDDKGAEHDSTAADAAAFVNWPVFQSGIVASQQSLIRGSFSLIGVSILQEAESTDDMDPLPDLPEDIPGDMDPLPEMTGEGSEHSDELPVAVDDASDEMEVPLFGRLSAGKLGMPLFTFLVGLIDGFNPCAMWVLLFLLSVLVNIKDRRKILIIAGTFVLVSGLAYYAFMAAWLNVFMLIGLDRPAQIVLGCIAIVIGTINVKDFFAFGKGVSVSIPESAKPGIYARVRKIVAARRLWAALTGAIVLAVLVNIVELLCTAGLPALYTQILVMHDYPAAVNYLYLGLYIIAYMLDDALLVGIVVVTLSKKKLQESHGRWLKLISGVAILLLGVIMLLRPELLV